MSAGKIISAELCSLWTRFTSDNFLFDIDFSSILYFFDILILSQKTNNWYVILMNRNNINMNDRLEK